DGRGLDRRRCRPRPAGPGRRRRRPRPRLDHDLARSPSPARPAPRAAAHDLAGTTISLDRHRLRDRLRELRLWPWAGIAGDGARLRLAAARAALGVLVEATPDPSMLPAPELVIFAGAA